VTLTFVSGKDWPWYGGDLSGADGGALGTAVEVCAAPAAPPDCPAGAIVYMTGTNPGWSANTSAYPAARWIWRGDTSASGVSDLLFAVFQASFQLGSSPAGSISIAADDYAEVRVNGAVAGSVGSITNESLAGEAQATFTTISLTPYLVAGTNTITIVGQNGPNTYVGGGSVCSPCTYAHNTAGVVFGGTLTYVSTPGDASVSP
jgi:hypothetical protein